MASANDPSPLVIAGIVSRIVSEVPVSRIGMGFLGQVGMFKELPRKKEITESDYESIINKSYFLR